MRTQPCLPNFGKRCDIHQAQHLLAFFNHSEIECFVHIDRKYKGRFSDVKNLLEKQGNIHILDERYSGTLSDWSLVRITMLLVEAAVKYGTKKGIVFNYYGLFSGQDYPIKPWNEFWNALENNDPGSYIDITKYGENGLEDMFHKIRYWKVQNFLYSYIRKPWLRKICKIPVYGFEKLLTAVVGKPSDRLHKLGIEIYQGSAWWIIAHDVMIWILEQYRREEKYMAIIKNTTTPEEHFFQTMCMLSPYRERFSIGDHKHIYCNFTPAGKKSTGHPYTITKEQLLKENLFENLPFFFARKFDVTTDADAVEWIDDQILNAE